jgi:WD40 repeat protein
LALMGVPGEFRWFSEQALIAAEQHREKIPCLLKQFPILPGTHHFSNDGSLLYAPGQHTAYASVQRVFIEPGSILPLRAEYTWVFRTEALATASAFSSQGDFLALAVPTWGTEQNSAPTWSLKVFALEEERRADPLAELSGLPKLHALMWSPCGTKIFAASAKGVLLELEFNRKRVSPSRTRALTSPIRVFSPQSDPSKLLVGTEAGRISHIDLASLEETLLATLPGEITSLAVQQSDSYLAAVVSTGALHVLRREERAQ